MHNALKFVKRNLFVLSKRSTVNFCFPLKNLLHGSKLCKLCSERESKTHIVKRMVEKYWKETLQPLKYHTIVRFSSTRIMSVNRKLRTFQKIFSAIGFAPIGTTGTSKTKQQSISILHWIPALSFIAISLFQVSIQWTLYDDPTIGNIRLALINLYFLTVVTANVVANMQCLIFRREYFDIMQRIDDLQYLFAFKCTREVYSQRFLQSYRIKFFTIGFFVFAMAISSYTIHANEPLSECILTTITIGLEIICYMSSMHIIFIIDRVPRYTKQLNELLVDPQPYHQSTVASRGMVKILLNVKCIHLKIWKLVQQINTFFGYSLVILFVKYLLDIMYDLYWLFVGFEEYSWKSVEHLG